jgi:pyruvate/2-oxoglutarate dehydrogenase complex dihydrolipoamide acyltransferase (E2) component
MTFYTKQHPLISPPVIDFSATAYVRQWFVIPGNQFKRGEPLLALTDRVDLSIDVYAPTDGVLDVIKIYADEPAPTAAILALLSVHESYEENKERNWDNFDRLSDILSVFTEKSHDIKQMKDMNEALGELLGVKEGAIFEKMSVDQQNQFVQQVIDQYQEKGLSPAVMAQNLLVGLQLRPPQPKMAPSAPSLGLRPSAPGMGIGGGGGGARVQQQAQQQTLPPDMPPRSDTNSN